MKLTIPELSLVVLIGASGSGKSTFARRHFLGTEVLSSDFFRGLVADDENDQSASRDAFDTLHFVASKRLAAGRLTVIDATNVQEEARKPLIELARRYHALPVAIVLNHSEKVCFERNQERSDRNLGRQVIARQVQDLRRSLRRLEREGFRHVHVLTSPEEVEAATIERQPLWNNRREERGPFDIIGDVHGCLEELQELLARLGYTAPPEYGAAGGTAYRHPEGRRAVFVGDLVDRGPDSPGVLRLVMTMVEEGTAFCVPGNHDERLLRKLRGRNVNPTHGLDLTLAQLEREPAEFLADLRRFLDGLVSHYVFDEGRLVVAHAGMKQEMQGRGSSAVRQFALYGETTGETDEYGLSVRHNWAAEYRGAATVVYGHTPVVEPEWLNRTVNIDTGCVFGGRLTALRYPENELLSVPAGQVYAEPIRPLAPAVAPARSAQQEHDELLDLEDVVGKRRVETRLHGAVTIREENAIAALEVMVRFAADPRWLVYLPPTMSPSETSQREGLLEHPEEAFAYYQRAGVSTVICEQKHMGSRAVVVICRDEEAARRRFGVTGDGSGIIYTRTGRRFFDDREMESGMLERIRVALTTSGLWEELQTDWLCLDCELMPWSAKAQSLLLQQYAPTGTAALASLDAATQAMESASARGLEVGAHLEEIRRRRDLADRYVRAYRGYCWPVHSLEDLKLAPFHLLATEGRVHADRDHSWHMEILARLCAADPGVLLATPYRVVPLEDETAVAETTAWWEALTGSGGEGMVVKPQQFIARGSRGLIQPAVKCRGPEYLRIIYGPEYTRPEHLERLRMRGLGAKRSLALREFALGLEGLERFVARDPLRRVHECVFGVLALESEPVDPRL